MSKIAITLYNLIMSYCIFRIFIGNTHFLSIFFTSANRCIYCTIFFNIAINNSLVFTLKAMFLNLFSKSIMSKIILCYNQESTCIFIYSMDNTGS